MSEKARWPETPSPSSSSEPVRPGSWRRSSRRLRAPAVLLLERTRDGGRKILVSGGGRCNVLPSAVDAGAVRHRLVAQHAAQDPPLLAARRAAALLRGGGGDSAGPGARDAASSSPPRTARATCATGCSPWPGGAASRSASSALVEDLVPPGRLDPGGASGGRRERSPRAAVIVATGGLSLPGTGSDGTGLAIVRRLGHTLHATYPALTPLTARAAPLRRRSPASRAP